MNETIVWKSVDEEMPDAGIECLVMTNNGPEFASYDDDYDSGFWRYARCGSKLVGHVLYWAEVPEGPSE